MSPPRFTPRHVFVGVGLTLAAIGLWRDRDLLNVPRLDNVFHGAGEGVEEPEHRVNPRTGTEHLYAAIRAHDSSAFTEALSPNPNALSIAPGDVSAEPAEAVEAGWEAYLESRAKAWPDYARSLDELIAACEASGRLDPDNGAHEAIAAMAELEQAVFPSPSEFLLVVRIRADREHGMQRFKVVDPERLDSALTRLERALSAPRFEFGSRELLASLNERIPETLPLETFTKRLVAYSTAPIPNLISLRSHANTLGLIAQHRREFGGGDPEQPLTLSRRLGLRIGAGTPTLIELMIGYAVVNVSNEDWLLHAVEVGEAQRAAAVSREAVLLERTFAHGYELDSDPNRLGKIDNMLIPNGGWSKDSGYDQDLGRRMEHAFVESVLLWGLAMIALSQLCVAWWKSRILPAGPTALTPGWTLGDVLGVVVPSFGVATAAALLIMRLHPARSFGMGNSGDALFLHGCTVLAFGFAAFPWLLRRAALRKLGLGWTQPSRARWAATAFLAGAYVATAWVGAGVEGTRLSWLAGGLLLSGLLLGAYVVRLPGADRTTKQILRRMEGRVGLAGLGLALTLVAGAQILLVAPRRDGLVRRYSAMQMDLDMAQAWGDGHLQDELRRLLRDAPDGPTPRKKPG